MNLENLTLAELEALRDEIDAHIAQKKPSKLIVELDYNKYKGSGKCWIAKVDPDTKKIQGFLDAESVQPRDNYSGKKTFVLFDGYYLFCQSGSKSTDSRNYYRIKNGIKEEF